MDDLSEHERRRLENIQRNAQFLNSLGFGIHENRDTSKKEKEVKNRKRKVPNDETTHKVVQTRYSLRNRAAKPDYDQSISSESESETGIDYDVIPMIPDFLDDFEFQVYVNLRKWRLLLSRDKEIEAYKVFQNDGLCSMIRRKRNNRFWGSRFGEHGQEKENGQIEQELLESRGIGPSKCKVDPPGYGWLMMQELEKEDNVKLLEQSRSLSAPSA